MAQVISSRGTAISTPYSRPWPSTLICPMPTNRRLAWVFGFMRTEELNATVELIASAQRRGAPDSLSALQANLAVASAAFPQSHTFSRTRQKRTDKCRRDEHRNLIRFLAHAPRAGFSNVFAKSCLSCESGSNAPKSAAEFERFSRGFWLTEAAGTIAI
jgi:hypothetical protein